MGLVALAAGHIGVEALDAMGQALAF